MYLKNRNTRELHNQSIQNQCITQSTYLKLCYKWTIKIMDLNEYCAIRFWSNVHISTPVLKGHVFLFPKKNLLFLKEIACFLRLSLERLDWEKISIGPLNFVNTSCLVAGISRTGSWLDVIQTSIDKTGNRFRKATFVCPIEDYCWQRVVFYRLSRRIRCHWPQGLAIPSSACLPFFPCTFFTFWIYWPFRSF